MIAELFLCAEKRRQMVQRHISTSKSLSHNANSQLALKLAQQAKAMDVF